jgi:hypothetical protein
MRLSGLRFSAEVDIELAIRKLVLKSLSDLECQGGFTYSGCA